MSVGSLMPQFQCQTAASFSHASAVLSKAEKPLTMRDKNHHKFKLHWNPSQARSLYKTCHLPVTDTSSYFKTLPKADLLFTACVGYLLPPQTSKYVHMRGSISSGMRHWKVYKDLNLKQDFTRLEIKIILKNKNYDTTKILLAVDNIQNLQE